jgi:tetratricopeptide (TPR) repeat protein
MRKLTTFTITASLFALSVTAHSQEQQTAEDEIGLLDQTVPVAEETVATTPEVAPAEEVTEQSMSQEFTRFRELLAEQNYDEADVSAKRIVEMAIKLYGPQSHETAKALNNLAIVQHNNRQYPAAIQNFTAAVEILEVVNDRLNEALVNPLRGLGAAQLGNGRPDLAMRTFTRATHITHVNEGPHNVQQVEILESIAEASVRLGDLESARSTLDRIHSLNVRHFKDDVLGLLPSLMRRADWQHRAGYYNDERVTYRRAIRIIETAAGKNDPRLVGPLIQLGDSFYYYDPLIDGGRSTFATGEVYFKRAARIAEGAEDYPWLDRAKARLALADYYITTETHNRARKIYLQVWNDLSLDEDRMEMRREMLELPVPIREEALPLYTNGSGKGNGEPASGFRTGSVQVDYTISTRGRVKDIRTEVNPIEFDDMLRMVHREIRRRVFRPTLEEGVPIHSDNQVFRHEFYYTEGELEALRRKKMAAQEKDAKGR